jgi:putative inorganic carbon (HCO3(-)) transporter
LPIILFLLSGIFSYLTSPFAYASFNEVIKRFIYCAFALIFINDFHTEKDLMRLTNWLIAATFVACGYGILQVIDLYFLPPPPAPGLDPFIWRQAFGARILSTFGNPNFYGDFLITMGPIVLALTLYKRKVYLALLWLALLFCTYHTYSKGAWVATASGNFAFIILFVFVFLREKLNKKIVISSLVLLAIIISVIGYGVHKQARGRMDSISFRVFTWMSTWDMINTHPVLGTGIGTFYVTYPAFRRPQIFYIEGKHNNESDHPENEYLEVWFDEGIIGFTIFLALIGFVFIAGIRNILYVHRSGNASRDGPIAYLQLGLSAAFVAKLTHDAFCVSLRFVSSGVMLWFLIGATLAISVMYVKKNSGEVVGKSKAAQAGAFFERYKKLLKTIAQIIIVIGAVLLIKYLGAYFTADILHSRAITYSKMGNWELAIDTYTKVSQKNPSFPMSHYFKGNVHLDRWKAGDPQLFYYEFNELWKLAPDYVQSRYLEGIYYSKLWREKMLQRNEYIKSGRSAAEIEALNASLTDLFQKAIIAYRKFMMIDPIYPLTYYNLASLFADIGDVASAEKILYAHLQYPEILLRHPYDIWVDRDAQGKAIDWRTRVPQENAETYFQLGNLYNLSGLPQPAIDAYKKSLDLEPSFLLSLKNLAALYVKVGNRSLATETWRQVLRVAPNDEDARAYFSS